MGAHQVRGIDTRIVSPHSWRQIMFNSYLPVSLSSFCAFLTISLGLLLVGFLCMWLFLNPTTRVSTFFMDGAYWVYFCCRHLPVWGVNVRSFWVSAMVCIWAWTRPQFMLSCERVFGNGVRTHVNSKEKSPLLDAQRRVRPATLHQAGQWAQHTIDWAIWVPSYL